MIFFGRKATVVTDVARLATQLAVLERLDLDATRELHDAAKGDRRLLLRIARLYAEQDTYSKQKIYKLLQGAVSGVPPDSEMPEPELRQLRYLMRMPRPQAFEVLAGHVPPLLVLQTQASDALAVGAAPDSREFVVLLAGLRAGVERLLGPAAWPDTTLLGSSFAAELSFRHIAACAGYEL